MKLLFKKFLVNILMLMVVMLPLRDVFSVPMDMSSNHCDTTSMNLEMTMTEHIGHTMPSSLSIDKEIDQKISSCACCNQCDGDCATCVHMSSAITFKLLQLTDLKDIELLAVVSDSLLTRTISPPSRPPLTL